MSLFIGLQNAHLIQAGKVILKACQWQIHQGERFALIGRNGVGKSTLMQVLSNHLALDSGVIHFQKGLTVASLPQDLTKSFGETVFDDIFARVKQQGGLVASIQKSDFTVFESHIILHARFHDDPHLLHFVKEFNELVAVMQLGLHMPFLGLSGGMKRRCALIAALLVQPDVLLLDEPTNHLDISAIMWLENYLKRYPGAVVLVTHDRFFLQAVATHIVALNDGILKQYNSSYEVYLNERAREEAEALNETNRLQQKLIQEEHWLQRGVTARRKRNQGRLKALNDLRDKVALLQKSIGVAGNWDPQLIRSGRVLVNVENISYSVGDVVLLKDFSFLMMRGDKLGIVGPNGCGKTTLAKMLLGTLQPTEGQIKFGPNIQPIYFDQLQQKLNLNETVMFNLADGAEYVDKGDEKIHVAGYLKEFSFDASHLQRPVHTLSGGEKQRLMLARCLAEKGNLMVFDEPSNDLDLETIEELSNMLVQYSGTFILISHDRALIQDVVTRLLVWESPGVFREILPTNWHPEAVKVDKVLKPVIKSIVPTKSTLSYIEQKELLKCPDEIAKIEKKIADIHTVMGDASFYQLATDEMEKWRMRLKEQEDKLDAMYQRWEVLEQKQEGSL